MNLSLCINIEVLYGILLHLDFTCLRFPDLKDLHELPRPVTATGTIVVPNTRMAELNVQKHVKYTKLCLNLLPSPFTSNDSNRLSLGFFLINTLDILDQLQTISQRDREGWIDWIYSCQVESGGFRGSTGTKTPEPSIYDTAHLPAAYFAIASLLVLGDDLRRVNRTALLSTLKKLQNEDGSFSPVLIDETRFGEVDVRHLYCAIAARHMLSPIAPEEDINVEATINYIRRCKAYDGGYSQSPGLESHAGSTYCCVASLSLLGKSTEVDDDTIRWLASRQISTEDEEKGGFNGRVNKPADTCYSFWVGGALDILGVKEFVSSDMNRQYLLTYTQHAQLGGFGKEEGVYPDPLHTCLALASLTLNSESHLLEFDAALCITKRALERLSKAPWRE